MPNPYNLFAENKSEKPAVSQAMATQQEWKAANDFFELNPNETRLDKQNIPDVMHDFLRLQTGAYAITALIGSGSKGAINLAQDQRGNHVVIKVTELDEITFPDISQETQESFEDMDELVEFMESNPNLSSSAEEVILKQNKLLLDSALVRGEDSDDMELAIAMPYLGEDLFKFLHKTKKEWDDNQLLDFSVQCIELVENMHQVNGFIHGDISISNFLINDNKKISLIDFGSSVKIDPARPNDNYPLPPAVDERYSNVPPEYKKRICSAKSDTYRLSAVLNELLPKNLSEDHPLRAIIKKMSATEPESRPSLQSIKETYFKEIPTLKGRISPTF